MTNIVEIIPDDIPEWAAIAIQEGQLFNICLWKIKRYEQIISEAREQLLLSSEAYDKGCSILKEAEQVEYS